MSNHPSNYKTKRKSTGDLPNGTMSRPTKQPRLTLDTFFSPKVSVKQNVGIEDVGKGVKDKAVDVVLSDEQRMVLRMVVDEGKNVFFTGSAGTGKSLLLRAMIAALRKKHAKKPDAVSVTASTGMAASNIGGMTIHSWGAIAPTVDSIDKLISYIRTAKPALQRWRATQVLVIDEVSMVDGHLFDRLAALATRLRKATDRPFGGIQLVVTGDFFQLPPVTKGNEVPFFAFESEAWSRCIQHTVLLTQVFRQKDNKFVNLLNELRHGTLTPTATSAFRALSRSLLSSPSHNLPPTELFPLRHEVDRANATRLVALRTPAVRFRATDSGAAAPDKRERVLAGMPVPAVLELKTGAQVMLVRNVDERRGLVNGAVGVVRGFYPALGARAEGVVRDLTFDENGKPVPSPEAPRSEKLKEEKKGGQATRDKGKENKKPPSSTGTLGDADGYPYVEFVTPQGPVSVLVTRDEFKVEDNEGNVLARRVQVPLILAWAISIHKSQGQTIQRVKIDLGKVFEKGQSYVALSRAASMEGLQVLHFDPKKVLAHPKVVAWSKTLEPVDTSPPRCSVS